MPSPLPSALPSYFGSITIAVEEPGTVIIDHRTGQEATVEEGTVLCLGDRMWLTPKQWEAFQAHPEFATMKTGRPAHG